ncbi:MAG: sulfur carrier protein ThiS [Candidatus Tenebribacter burtonii]|nr:sulfur carrier protein ThiS [Candidatus Tenebribacter burtonii]
MKIIIVNGNSLNWEEEMNIDLILKRKNYTFKMLVVKVDGKLIKKTEYSKTYVQPGADVKVIHLISGG